MDMPKFDVILRMDWLTAYQVVIDCERRRFTTYTKAILMLRFHMERTVDGLDSYPYPRG